MVELLYRSDGNPDALAAKVNLLQGSFYKRTGCFAIPLQYYKMCRGKPLGVEISEADGNLEKAVRAVVSEIGVPYEVIAEGRAAYELVGKVLQESGYALKTPLSSFILFFGPRGKVVTALN